MSVGHYQTGQQARQRRKRGWRVYDRNRLQPSPFEENGGRWRSVCERGL